jgi:hypothetical protein
MHGDRGSDGHMGSDGHRGIMTVTMPSMRKGEIVV